MEFAQAVEDYLGWMKANGYADSTILAHAKALKRFGKFVESARIPWPESLTYAFVRHYRQAEGPWARTDAVKGLSRFLCAKGFVRSPIEKPVRKLPEIYEDYLAYFKNARGVGDGYLDDARRLLSAFRMYLERRGLDLGRVEIEHVDEFLAGRNRRFSSSANRRNRSHLGNFFKYLRFELRIVKKDIAGLIVGATEFAQRKPPKFLRPGETELVFENLSFDDKKSCRQAAMVHLAFSLGLRPKEICSVLLDDISFERGAIVIPKRKCDNPVELPLPEAAIKAVARDERLHQEHENVGFEKLLRIPCQKKNSAPQSRRGHTFRKGERVRADGFLPAADGRIASLGGKGDSQGGKVFLSGSVRVHRDIAYGSLRTSNIRTAATAPRKLRPQRRLSVHRANQVPQGQIDPSSRNLPGPYGKLPGRKARIRRKVEKA